MNGMSQPSIPWRTPGRPLPEPPEPDPITESTVVREKLRPLRRYLDAAGVLEVCVNRPREVWVQGEGGWTRHDEPQATFRHLQELATAVATLTGQHTAERHPLLSASLPSGERIQFVQPAAALPDTVVVAMRKPSAALRRIDELDAGGMFRKVRAADDGPDLADELLLTLQKAGRWGAFLRTAVRARKTIALCGATGSGKTTFLKALCAEIPAEERLITIEDAAELTLPDRGNKVHLFYSKGGQGASEVTASSLLEACLRLKPDRIIQAELRGEEACAFLDLAASGHPGSMTTLHAGSCDEAFDRIALMVRKSAAGGGMTMAEIGHLARSVIDIVVHVACEDGTFAVTGVHFDPLCRTRRLHG